MVSERFQGGVREFSGRQQGRCGCDVVAGAEWGTMGLYGLLWGSMGYYGALWITMILYELLCVLIGYDGFQ